MGCPLFRTPVGEIHVVERMLAENAVLGGEGNGGVIDPRVGYVRDSFVAMGLVLDLMAASGEPLSALVNGLPRYTMVKEQYPIGSAADVAALWDRIAAAYPEARVDRRDGLRLEWNDRWVHIRASNTEPIVRVIAEASEPAGARDLTGRIGRWVSSSSETTA
jgi:phosphomannomutase